MVKGTKLYSISHFKCPRCQEGDIFVHKGAYVLKNMGEMYKSCPRCGLNYQPEPGFYYGAGYVSYAIAVALSVTVFVALLPFVHWYNFEIYMIAIGFVLLVTAPLNFRVSRVVWLHFFNRYDEKAIEKHDLQKSQA